MPAKSKAQQRMMGAELARRRAGKKCQVCSMTDQEVEDYAHGSDDMPERVERKKPTRTKRG